MNVNFQYSKTLAIEGSILLLLGLIPTVGWILAIVGIVLLLKATKELSNYYQDESIHKNAWTGLKYYIVALIALAVGTGIGITSFATAGLFTGVPVRIHSRYHWRHHCNTCGSSSRIRVLLTRSSTPKKSIQHTRTENRRSIIRHSSYTDLLGRNTNNNRHWRIPDTDLMDIRHNRLLKHEAQRIPTLHCTTKRIQLRTTNPATNIQHLNNKPKTKGANKP